MGGRRVAFIKFDVYKCKVRLFALKSNQTGALIQFGTLGMTLATQQPDELMFIRKESLKSRYKSNEGQRPLVEPPLAHSGATSHFDGPTNVKSVCRRVDRICF